LQGEFPVQHCCLSAAHPQTVTSPPCPAQKPAPHFDRFTAFCRSCFDRRNLFCIRRESRLHILSSQVTPFLESFQTSLEVSDENRFFASRRNFPHPRSR
jgi:hypothetical protein